MRAPSRPEILSSLEALFARRLHVPAPAADVNLLESGVLDSLQFVDLLAAVEREFGISIPLDGPDFDRLTTLAALAQLVHELGEVSHDADVLRPAAPRL